MGPVKIPEALHLGALVCSAILDDSHLVAEGHNPQEDVTRMSSSVLRHIQVSMN